MDAREKLVEILKEPCGGLYPACELADYLFANGVTVSQWISVDDRLPKDWTDVLILSRFGFLETAVYTGAPGKWRVGWNGDMLEADSITHWMPLPQPPKGE